jgi:hypothetical protein
MLKRVPAPYTSCWCRKGIDESPDAGTCEVVADAAYNQPTCKDDCEMKHIRSKCNCSIGFDRSTDYVQHCYTGFSNGDANLATDKMFLCALEGIAEIASGTAPCNCEQACTEIGYIKEISANAYPNTVHTRVLTTANAECWSAIAALANRVPTIGCTVDMTSVPPSLINRGTTNACTITRDNLVTTARSHLVGASDLTKSASDAELHMLAYEEVSPLIKDMKLRSFTDLGAYVNEKCGVKPSMPGQRWLNEPDAEWVDKVHGKLQREIAVVKIFWGQFSVETVTWSPKWDPFSFLGSIGGTTGLFCGISLVTLVEFLELLVLLPGSLVLARRSAAKDTKVMPMDAQVQEVPQAPEA